MSNLIFKLSTNGRATTDDVFDWFGDLESTIRKINVDVYNSSSRQNQIDIVKKLMGLGADLKATADTLKIVDLTYKELNDDLIEMKLDTIDKNGGFNYLRNADSLENMGNRINKLVDSMKETIDSGNTVDYTSLKEVLNVTEGFGRVNALSTISTNLFKSQLAKDIYAIDSGKDRVEYEAKPKGYKTKDLPSISSTPMLINKINRLNDKEDAVMEKFGFIPVREPIFDVKNLFNEDIKNGVSKVKAHLYLDVRVYFNGKAIKEFFDRVAQAYVYDNPFREFINCLKDIAGMINWTFNDKNIRAGLFSEVEAKNETNYSQNFLKLISRDKIDNIDLDDPDISSLTFDEYDALRTAGMKKIEKRIERGEKIKNTYYNELRKANTIVDGLEKKEFKGKVLTEVELRVLDTNKHIIDKLESIPSNRRFDLQENEFEAIKVSVIIDNEFKVEKVENTEKIIKDNEMVSKKPSRLSKGLKP